MALNVRSEEVNRLAEELARRTHQTKTDALKRALQNDRTTLLFKGEDFSRTDIPSFEAANAR